MKRLVHIFNMFYLLGLSLWVGGMFLLGILVEIIVRIKLKEQPLLASEVMNSIMNVFNVEIIYIEAGSAYVKGGANNSLMEAVVSAARSRASAGDTVLLAPACASMDQFISYADRGDRCLRWVERPCWLAHLQRHRARIVRPAGCSGWTQS